MTSVQYLDIFKKILDSLPPPEIVFSYSLALAIPEISVIITIYGLEESELITSAIFRIRDVISQTADS